MVPRNTRATLGWLLWKLLNFLCLRLSLLFRGGFVLLSAISSHRKDDPAPIVMLAYHWYAIPGWEAENKSTAHILNERSAYGFYDFAEAVVPATASNFLKPPNHYPSSIASFLSDIDWGVLK